MKFKSLALILASALSVNAAGPALAETKAAPPATVTVGGMDGFIYWLAKKLVFDIDETLKKQGIDSKLCTFRQAEPKQDFSYRGVGLCLYKNFMKSMKTEQMAGTVYTWIQDRQGRLHPVEIQWRPPRGGWMKLIRQLVEMRLEKPLYTVRSKVLGAESAEKLRYNEFLIGDLKIILPEDPAALEVLAAKGGVWAKSYLAKIHSVDLHLAATGNDRGKVIYDGALMMNHHAAEDGSVESTKVILRTNVNVVVLKRPFFLNGKVRSNGASEDPLPGMDAEALP